MLMAQSLICQTVYPKKAVIDKDTVCIITIEQAKTMNVVFVDRRKCYELNDSLNSMIKNYDILVGQQQGVIVAQDKEIQTQNKIIAEKDTIIRSDEKLLKKQNRKVGWLKVQRTVFATVAIISVGILTYEQLIANKP